MGAKAIVMDAMQRRPSLLVQSLDTCHLQQLFRLAVFRLVLGCLHVLMLGLSALTPRDNLTNWRRWQIEGLVICWGCGLPHFLAVVGAGVRVMKGEGCYFEVHARLSAARRFLSCLLALSLVLSIWQGIWWLRGSRLLFSLISGQKASAWLSCACTCCWIIYPIVILAVHVRDRQEQGKAMKGAAAGILLLPMTKRSERLQERAANKTIACQGSSKNDDFFFPPSRQTSASTVVPSSSSSAVGSLSNVSSFSACDLSAQHATARKTTRFVVDADS